MQLHEHLAAEKLPIQVFAGLIEVSVQAVHRYLSGERTPRLEVLERIKTATGGKVGPEDFHAARLAYEASKREAAVARQQAAE